MSGNYYFYIVNRFDSLIYEMELLKNNPAAGEKKVRLFRYSFKIETVPYCNCTVL